MKYIVAILLPPLAVLAWGKPKTFLINVVLTLLGWFPGIFHAFWAMSNPTRPQHVVSPSVNTTKNRNKPRDVHGKFLPDGAMDIAEVKKR